MTNWNLIFVTNRIAVEKFAAGGSSRNLFEAFANTYAAGEVRKLIRGRGTNEARTLARKAVARRS